MDVSQFIDGEAKVTPAKKGRPKRTAEKEVDGPPKKRKIGVRERKSMLDGQKEIETLLHLLVDPKSEPQTHYEFAFTSFLVTIASAMKWAWEVTFLEEAYALFWDWWSGPMLHVNNKVWARKLLSDEDLRLNNLLYTKRDEMEALKVLSKADWTAAWDKAIADKSNLAVFRGWVRHELKHRQITLNPGTTDKEIADLAKKYLDTFIVVDVDGSSASYDKESKLWILRKKERSPVALGEALLKLIDHKIQFSDPDLRRKFHAKLANTAKISTVLNWLKGQIPVFPHPMKDKLDADTWTFPLADGKIVDLRTLEIRDRNQGDLFTMESNIHWFVDEHDVMDSKLFAVFKTFPMDREEILRKLCPNAYEFTQGPFRDDTRHQFMLMRIGLFLSTYCSRKGIWIYGDGRGMKSTLLSAIIACMGPFAVNLAKKVFFTSPGSDACHNTDLMRAEKKRLVVIDELERKDILKESLYKQAVARGIISAREIFGGQGEWMFYAQIVFLTNTIITLHFTDAAVSDRLLPIRGTTRVFNPTEVEKRPPHFTTEEEWKDGQENGTGVYWVMRNTDKERWAESFLKPEAEGGHQNELGCFMILCAHLACLAVNHPNHRGELPIPDAVAQDYVEFLREADPVGQFLDEACVLDEGHQASLKNVYKDFKDPWCREQGIKPLELKSFQQSLRSKGLLTESRGAYYDEKAQRMKKTGPSYWVKVGLRSAMTFDIGETVLVDKDPSLSTDHFY